MATLSEARQVWQKAAEKFQKVKKVRTGFLGDGRGTSDANLFVPGREDYVFARDDITSPRFFQILNRGAVQPAHNLPVLIGYPEPIEEGQEEQIVGIHYTGLGGIPSDTIPQLGPHHQQHEFRGGDDVLIEPRQFMPGRVYPTNPTSMRVNVTSFVYFYNGWSRFGSTTSKDLTEYIPSAGEVTYILISLDPDTQSLTYHRKTFPVGHFDVIYSVFANLIPTPTGTEIPLGYVKLLSSTTAIDWTAANDNIGDARLFVGYPADNILDRLRQLEGITGNPPTLTMMGAATFTVDEASGGGSTFSGSGTAGRLARWTDTTVLGSSLIRDDGTQIGIGASAFSGWFVRIQQPSATSGSPVALRVACGTHTGLNASTEMNDVIIANTRTVTWASGNITTQRFVDIGTPTIAFSGGASTVTTAATLAIEGAPIAGTDATLTNSYAFWVQSGRVLVGDAGVNPGVDSIFEVSASLTAAGTSVAGIELVSTLTAEANSRIMYGTVINPLYAKSTFTSLDARGLIIQAQAPTGSGTIATYTGLQIVEKTFATSNIALLVGTHPGGSTNYAIYSSGTTASVLGGGLNLGTATGAGTGAVHLTSRLGYSVNNGNDWYLRTAGIQFGFAIKMRPNAASGGAANRHFQIGYIDNDDTYGAILQVDDSGHLLPLLTAGTQNLGDGTNYWADISYKTLTDRGCLGWFDGGVELADGSIVSDTEALLCIRRHPTLETVYGVPRLDYSTMPKAVYKPALREGETEGAETTALISIMLGAIRELTLRVKRQERATTFRSGSTN